MTEGLNALLGCVQGEVSQLDPFSQSRQKQSRLTEHIVLPTPPEGLRAVAVVCKYCQQAVRIRVQSLPGIRRKRLTARLAMALAVCLWSAGAAFVMLYLLNTFPRLPGAEAPLAAVLVGLGVLVWVTVDAYDAFAGDVALGCRIEQTAQEKVWRKQVSREGLRAMTTHVLLDPEVELAFASERAEKEASLARERRKAAARTHVVTHAPLGDVGTGSSSRIA